MMEGVNALPLAPQRVLRLIQEFHDNMELRQSIFDNPPSEGSGIELNTVVPTTAEIFGTKVQSELNRTAGRSSLGQILKGRFFKDAGNRKEDDGATCLLSGDLQKIYRTQAVSSCT